MSVLDTPRIYFQGQITWDPLVTNNRPDYYDVETSRTVFGTGDVAAYRERARLWVLEDLAGHNWNVHGTHRSAFFNATVTGVDVGRGLRRKDDLTGVPVSLSGMLVDVDPYGFFTSQLFFDVFSCGIPGGCSVLARSCGPMVARRMNGRRILGDAYRAGGASAVWQTSFPTDRLSVHPRGSQVLAALAESMKKGKDVVGLTVRLNTYRTIYYGTPWPTSDDQQRLAGRIGQGGFHPNPARSLMVGVIGLWRDDESPSVPCDRVLARAGKSKLGTAFARLHDKNRLSIDLSNSVPECGFDGTKKDLGPLTVVASTDDDHVPLGTLEYAHYNAEKYQDTSGIVTLVLGGTGADAAASADLQIRAPDDTVLLAEQRFTVVADPPNVYLEQKPEGVPPDENNRATVSLRAFRRGKPPGTRVSVSVIEVGGPLAPREVVTNKAGKATLSLHGGRGGTWTWLLVPWTGEAPPLPEALDPEVTEYLTLRTTAADERVAALEATWENVHHHVLRYWEAMAPCMDNWLRLGDEEQCRAYAGLIRSLTSRERFNSYRYMPVTRDLTPGQRALLHRWCAEVLGQDPPTPETTTG